MSRAIFSRKLRQFKTAVKWLKMHQIECFLFMEVDIIMDFYVLKSQIPRCKDGWMGTIFVKTYFLLNKIKIEKMNDSYFNKDKIQRFATHLHNI